MRTTEGQSRTLKGIQVALKDLLSILENLKSKSVDLDRTSVVVDFDSDQAQPIIQTHEDPLSFDDYQSKIEAEWDQQEQLFKKEGKEPENILPLKIKKPSLMFLPLLLTESWLPLRGNHIQFQRINRGVRISSATDYYSNGQPIGIPSGLLARRILIALVSRSVQEKSREIDVKSVSELLRESSLGKSGKQSKRIQKTIFQLFMTNVKIWTDKDIHVGSMFDTLGLDVSQTEQEKFSFIPDRVVFKEKFYNDVLDGKSYPFLADDILKASGALEHDVLLWLLNRQTRVGTTTGEFIGYGLLYHQFGQPNQAFHHFKHEFKKIMKVIREKHHRKFELHKNGVLLFYMPERVKTKQETKIRF